MTSTDTGWGEFRIKACERRKTIYSRYCEGNAKSHSLLLRGSLVYFQFSALEPGTIFAGVLSISTELTLRWIQLQLPGNCILAHLTTPYLSSTSLPLPYMNWQDLAEGIYPPTFFIFVSLRYLPSWWVVSRVNRMEVYYCICWPNFENFTVSRVFEMDLIETKDSYDEHFVPHSQCIFHGESLA